MNIDQSLAESFRRYGDSIANKDVKSTLNFIYSKLFEFIPKKTIESSLKAAYTNKTVDVVFKDFKIVGVEFEDVFESAEYKIITISCHQTTTYLSPHNNADEIDESEFHYDVLKEKYGADNVTFDRENRIITTNATNLLLAIKAGSGWSFLELKPHFVELYGKFLPSKIVDEIAKQFPVEENKEDEESEVEEAPREKKNTVTDLSKKRNLKSLFLIGWEVNLNGDRNCENFIATQVTDQKTFEYAYSGLELIFENKKLIKVNEYTDGKRKARRLEKDEIGLPYKAYKPNVIFTLQESLYGIHQLGGEKPGDFELPASNCVVPFQYLGFIDNRDKNFKWLPFKLHLICPIYLNIDHVFLDYSDSLRPVILNKDEVEKADSSYEEELSRESEIVFSDVQFNFIEAVEFSGTGNAGIPNWIQYPDIPMCPKSGKRMKFLCQLNGGVTVKRTNVKTRDDWYSRYFEEMNFWGDGDLFVFFEPSSKVACYFIQNT